MCQNRHREQILGTNGLIKLAGKGRTSTNGWKLDKFELEIMHQYRSVRTINQWDILSMEVMDTPSLDVLNSRLVPFWKVL